ncbi:MULTISPECIES: hypothetical protein [Bacteria]|uniref:Uncharacterized protein n=1 Tax=Cellulomonas carbonis T26 TaxID=947969 RepID=A0A0A0BKX9_9CELL|nr:MULTISPECIES: hypothetical protein [Bacteria]KGM08535.1 hypothetical protein N868_08390 [Cellulomonas carbonis T26]KSV94867.1 hypothetical protein N184_36070 [Sinorhizobium sp. GL28]
MVKVKITDDTTKKVNLKTEINYVSNDDYEKLMNKPQINDVELVGNKSSRDIGIFDLSNAEIDRLVNMIFNKR